MTWVDLRPSHLLWRDRACWKHNGSCLASVEALWRLRHKLRCKHASSYRPSIGHRCQSRQVLHLVWLQRSASFASHSGRWCSTVTTPNTTAIPPKQSGWENSMNEKHKASNEWWDEKKIYYYWNFYINTHIIVLIVPSSVVWCLRERTGG
jgi:hypothetical protein